MTKKKNGDNPTTETKFEVTESNVVETVQKIVKYFQKHNVDLD